MKIKDIIDELSKYDENTEVFVNDDEGHERNRRRILNLHRLSHDHYKDTILNIKLILTY